MATTIDYGNPRSVQDQYWSQYGRASSSGSSGAAASNGSNPLLTSGDAAAGNSVGSAKSGVDAVLANSAQVNQAANQMRGQASLVNTQAGALNGTADQMKGLAGQMTPYAGQLSGIGDTLLGEGNALFDQAKDVFGQGGALVNMDPTAGGLAGEFIRQYGYLSPDRYVSQATSDTQGSFSNAWDQMVRGNARQGVNASSGNAQALKKQYATALATALASAKTKARQMGIDEQTKMLGNMTNAANTLYNMGKDTASAAIAAQNAGADAKKNAAGVLDSAAGVLGSAGNLQDKAGQLYANAASIIGSASNLVSNQANLTLNAYKDLAGAQDAAAKYYLSSYNVQNRGNGATIYGNVADNTDKAIAARIAANPNRSGLAGIVNGRVVIE